MCLNMIRKFLKNKQIIHSAYSWEAGNGEKGQQTEEKRFFFNIKSFRIEFNFAKSTYC